MIKRLLIIFGIFISTYTNAQDVIKQAEQEPVNVSLDKSVAASNVESLMLDYELARTQDFQAGLKIIRQSSLESMDEIANEINTLLPESFSSTYIKFKQSGFTETGLSYLKEAESKTENKAELYTDFLTTAHILNKEDLLNTYAIKLRNSGFINTVVLEYNKNVLRSIKENKAFVITNGWDDTYPLLTLLKEERKKNLTIINVEWLFDPAYREKLSQKLGMSKC